MIDTKDTTSQIRWVNGGALSPKEILACYNRKKADYGL